ncbi:MAG: CPBP family intramembrane metalloprotease [Saprospiraceae bacterium]|nr:CPBP family intramembrane metalloprotease [Bacteroidia bacterium]NNK90139.1 CPBP family intramembrane metalloprotease [Saprospiraceae bacterium]
MMGYFENAFNGKNHWWRYIVVILVTFIGYTIGQIPLMLSLWRSVNEENSELGMADIENFQSNPDFSVFGINSNMGFTLLLVMFIGALTAFYFIFKPMHGREFRSLITSGSRINWNKIFFAFSVWLSLSLVVEVVSYFMDPASYSFHFQFNTFIPLVIISLLILPIQTSMEELLFRGYLMQGIAVGTKSRLIPLIITSILFGFIHSMNPEIQEFGFVTMQVYYISAGLLLGILTIMDDSLELALGVHAATNIVGAVFVGYEGAAIQTDSLFKANEINPVFMTAGFILVSLVFILLMKYKYNWGSFKRILEPVNKIDDTVVMH